MYFIISLCLLASPVLSQDDFDLGHARELTNKSLKLPGLDICGLTNNAYERRIINGKPAKLGMYPWMAALGFKFNYDYTGDIKWFCGGSLVTAEYVITAAHCCEIPNPMDKKFLVRLGDLDLNETKDDGAIPLTFDIEKVTPHEYYNNILKVNDIALIKLRGKVNNFSDYIRPICLPIYSLTLVALENYELHVAGWGRTRYDEPDSASSHLLATRVAISNTGNCRAAYKEREVVINESVICASSSPNDACIADSGGPLMMYYSEDNKTKNVYLMGLVSYGIKCGLPEYPSVYTRVSNFMSWIITNMDI